jgi:hypothetical protein
MLRSIFLGIAALFVFNSYSQISEVKGKVTDKGTGESVVDAMLILGEFKVKSDEEGNFSFANVPYGNYELMVVAMDYDTVKMPVKVNAASLQLKVYVGGSTEIDEIRVIANIATDRKTPIAITKISAEKIQEELGSRDLPMVLNATPGVYATQTGGGDGDARITVRGFDQRNIGVLIDGVPVNDMENGAVYWSNWFGLDAITSQMQVQRGLGATKLSMPSVGGSLNIVTQGIQNRKGFSFKQEYGTGDFLRSTLSYNSGRTKKGWGFNFSGSYKQGNGWVDGTNTQGVFYYGKIQKKIGNHLISLSAFGAPQRHGQRSFYQPIQYWSTSKAEELGVVVDPNAIQDRGFRFNQHWGYITNSKGKKEIKNERLNYYHKPQVTLKDFWQVNKKLSISNIAYMSIGRGGGTRMSSSTYPTIDNQINWDEIVRNNRVDPLFGGPNVDPAYSPTLLKSTQVQVASINNHFWIGGLGQFQYEMNSKLTINGGIDYRYYKGTHYQEIYDLLGGEYYVSGNDKNSSSAMKKKGDKISLNSFNNHRDALVQWGGVFGSMEYSNARWSTFVNVSGVINAYKGIDYFQKKVLEVGDTTLRIGANDTVQYNGNTYTASSPGLEYFHTKWKTIPGATIKAGANYKLNENNNVFLNLGYLSRTPQFSNVIDNNTNAFFREIKNEVIQAIELGYTFAKKSFGINLNGYYTNWKNKPFPYGVAIPDPNDPASTIYVNVNGMDAIHYGGEVDVAYKINKKLQAEFMFSIGNWTWNSKDSILIPDINFQYTFDARGVHVGDAAQTMMNVGLRFEPIKNLYFKIQYQWFDRYYAAFSPFALKGENARHEAWKLPSYGIVNFFAGYSHKIKSVNLYFNGNISNLLNTMYIADATDSYYAPYNFDAQSASVVFSQGFRFNLALGVQF